jgi:hypothetical protein
MDKSEMPFGVWLVALIGATFLGTIVGGVLLGPPGAVAFAAICGRAVYGSRPRGPKPPNDHPRLPGPR